MIFSRGRFTLYIKDSLSKLGKPDKSEFLNITAYKNITSFAELCNPKGKILEIVVAGYKSHARLFAQIPRLTGWGYQTRFNLHIMLHDSGYIKKIPYYQRNVDIIRTLANMSINTIGFIHEDLMKPEYLQNMSCYASYYIEYLSDRLKTRTIITNSISMYPRNINHMPDNMLTDGLITELIYRNAKVINHLPDHIAAKYRRYPPKSS